MVSRRPSWTLLPALPMLPALLLLLLPCGCKREAVTPPANASVSANAPEPSAKPSAAPSAEATTAPTAGPSPLAGLQLYELRIEGVGEGSAGLVIDAAALRAAVVGSLPGVGPFLCGHERIWAAPGVPAADAEARTPPCPSDLRPSARTGVVISAAALAVDESGAPATLDAASQVLLQVRVHAERGDDAGKPIIGEANVEAPLPLPSQRKGSGLAVFLAQRAAAAARIAASDAGGQLLVRELDDATVIAWLEDEATWRVIAALREVGERGLHAERHHVEALARRSRPDVVTVAAATLGRIGDAGSVPVLVAVLSSASAEVCDAALTGLAELRSSPGDAARAAENALRAAAAQHPLPWIRQRARSLLGSGDGAVPGMQRAPEPHSAP